MTEQTDIERHYDMTNNVDDLIWQYEYEKLRPQEDGSIRQVNGGRKEKKRESVKEEKAV